MSGFSDSHYNSGCESGWTMYFEESFETDGRFRRSAVDYGGVGRKEEEEEVVEEGDLSMISDASSGPRNGYYYEENCQSVQRNVKESAAERSKRKEEMGRRNQHSCLDDTASSPVFGLSEVSFSLASSPQLLAKLFNRYSFFFLRFKILLEEFSAQQVEIINTFDISLSSWTTKYYLKRNTHLLIILC